MTNHVLDFLRKAQSVIGQPKRVLEVGSLNVNGTARSVFQSPEYVGIDLIAGKDVDVVLDAHYLHHNYPEESFDLVLCCEMLEHDTEPWTTVALMRTVLKSGGWLVITTPGSNVIKHNYPSDYYRYFGETYKDVFFKGMTDVFVEEFSLPENKFYNQMQGHLKPDEIHGYARKPL